MPHHANAGFAAQPREVIGEGTFGKVYLVRCSSTGEQIVLKESETIGLSTEEKEAMLNEALILKRLQHPAIIAYRQAYIRDDMFCIEMDWAAGGDLRSYIRKNRNEKQWLAETTVARHLWQHSAAELSPTTEIGVFTNLPTIWGDSPHTSFVATAETVESEPRARARDSITAEPSLCGI